MSRETVPAEAITYLQWDRIRAAVDVVTSNQLDHFDASTVANARDVLSICERHTTLPLGMKKGYWATVVLWWNKFEIEVFEDRIEVYRFHDQGTEIWHEKHMPGKAFTSRFLGRIRKSPSLKNAFPESQLFGNFISGQ